MRVSLASVAATGGALTVGALLFAGVTTALSVAVGAALGLGNLWALARIVSGLLPGQGRESAGLGGWAVLGALKMIGLMAAVWGLLHLGVVSALPLVVGFGALPLGIAIGAFVSDRDAAD
jgi:hypothetical protein